MNSEDIRVGEWVVVSVGRDPVVCCAGRVQASASKADFWWIDVDMGVGGPLMPQMFHQHDLLGLASRSLVPGRERARGLHEAAKFVAQNDEWMAGELSRRAVEILESV